jgi:hypothetical protein
MRHAPTLMLACASLLAGGSTEAEGADVEQCYFEVIVSKAGKPVARPHALVAIGADARLAFLPSKDKDGPQLGLKYNVEEKAGSELAATVTARVDDRDVATATVTFSRDESAAIEMEGGGYTWQLTVDLMTPELLERKRAARKR